MSFGSAIVRASIYHLVDEIVGSLFTHSQVKKSNSIQLLYFDLQAALVAKQPQAGSFV